MEPTKNNEITQKDINALVKTVMYKWIQTLLKKDTLSIEDVKQVMVMKWTMDIGEKYE